MSNYINIAMSNSKDHQVYRSTTKQKIINMRHVNNVKLSGQRFGFNMNNQNIKQEPEIIDKSINMNNQNIKQEPRNNR